MSRVKTRTRPLAVMAIVLECDARHGAMTTIVATQASKVKICCERVVPTRGIIAMLNINAPRIAPIVLAA
ncbi:MAG: hypothetical protein JRH17_14540 [Deltaproteobacteria bacterium]|nr:hypothetical protein [Deltaproteobacteria bacterium]